MAISCQGFLKQFDDARTTEITKPAILSQIDNRASSLRADTVNTGLDVRAQADFKYSNGVVSTLCLGKFGMQKDGIRLKSDETLVNLLVPYESLN